MKTINKDDFDETQLYDTEEYLMMYTCYPFDMPSLSPKYKSFEKLRFSLYMSAYRSPSFGYAILELSMTELQKHVIMKHKEGGSIEKIIFMAH